jgi:SAM-dependent methyltransferase
MPQVDYVGFDTDPRYIEYAREHYADRGRFVCEHFAQAHVAQLKPFDAIMLLGIIHHVNDAEAEGLFALLAKCLAPNGRVVTLDPCLTPTQSSIARWVAQADRGGFVRNEPAYRRLGADQFADVEARLVSNVCRIPSTELIMRLGRPHEPKVI